MKYPAVADEFETMRQVRDGASLARFGDGELKMMFGKSYARQTGGRKLATEMYGVLNSPAAGVLVGLPTLDPRGPKFTNWQRHVPRFERVLHRAGPFGSAFVTRPDSAPWIECEDYLALVLSVWRGKHVALVAEPTNKLRDVLAATAGSVTWIECPSHECYGQAKALCRAVEQTTADLCVLSCGVTATVLANRLGGRGRHALDFGSVGAMLVRLLDARACAA